MVVKHILVKFSGLERGEREREERLATKPTEKSPAHLVLSRLSPPG